MNTEEKIREAFRKFVKEHDDIYDDWESYKASYLSFKAGYLAMLNSLELDEMSCSILYRLPEGVKRDEWE